MNSNDTFTPGQQVTENDKENDVNSNLGITIRYFITDEECLDASSGMQKDRAIAISIAESLLYDEKGDDVVISDVTAQRVRGEGYRVEFTISGRKDRGEVYSDTVHADECSDPYCGHCR